nr:MAG TPA: hypothetical protein [Caudoviricetes sp.]
MYFFIVNTFMQVFLNFCIKYLQKRKERIILLVR